MSLSLNLIQAARQRCETKPSITEADLRRATSDCYYSLFHCICEALVEVIGADPEIAAARDTFETLYRLPDHEFADKRCREISKHDFCEEVQNFSKHFSAMRNKRRQADYEPLSRFSRSNVLNDIERTQAVVSAFRAADQQQRIRFAFFVSLKSTRN